MRQSLYWEKKPTRQKSLARDRRYKYILAADIINAFYKLDNAKGLRVKFVHMNLENVPRFSPEHTEEDITIARVSQHDQRIQAVEDRADIQAEAIRTLQMLVNDLIQTKPGPGPYSRKSFPKIGFEVVYERS